MIFTSAFTRSSVACWRGVGGHGDDPDDDALLPDDAVERRGVEHGGRADVPADEVGILVEDGGDVDPVLGEDRRACDRLTQATGADEGDVVLPLRAKDLANLGEQAVDE